MFFYEIAGSYLWKFGMGDYVGGVSRHGGGIVATLFTESLSLTGVLEYLWKQLHGFELAVVRQGSKGKAKHKQDYCLLLLPCAVWFLFMQKHECALKII